MQARLSAIGNTPVTIGSRVPKWDVLFRFSSFFMIVSTPKLVGPEGLSMFIIENSRSSFIGFVSWIFFVSGFICLFLRISFYTFAFCLNL